MSYTKEQMRDYMRAYRKMNPEYAAKEQKALKKWVKNNLERRREIARNSYRRRRAFLAVQKKALRPHQSQIGLEERR